jgi:hypothetical protein
MARQWCYLVPAFHRPVRWKRSLVQAYPPAFRRLPSSFRGFGMGKVIFLTMVILDIPIIIGRSSAAARSI